MPELMTLAGHAIDFVVEAEKRGQLDRVIDFFKKKHKVLVLGSTGVGKTNFLKSLEETMPEAVDIIARTQTIERKRVSLDRHPFQFIDTPGEGENNHRQHAIDEAKRHGAMGIINVVCYGYHEYRAVHVSQVFDGETVKPDFLEKHRQAEIEALKQWNQQLGHTNAAKWLMTVITKADLWMDSEREVLKHYTSGEYFQALGPAQELSPVVGGYCSVFHKFYGTGRTSGLIDDADRKRLRNNLVHLLIAASIEDPKR